MTSRVTRRQLTAVLALPAALLAQNPKADEELKAAREQLRQAADMLAKVEIPMATEPAVHFKV